MASVSTHYRWEAPPIGGQLSGFVQRFGGVAYLLEGHILKPQGKKKPAKTHSSSLKNH